MSWHERLAKLRATRQQEYAEKSPSICQQYGLDAERDKALIRELITAHNRLAICAACKGQCPNKSYTQPEIVRNGRGVTVHETECAYGKVQRLTAHAKQFVPKRYAFKNFDDYDVTEDNRRAVGMALWFLNKGDGRGLYLSGGVGTGKTFLASLIAKECVLRDKQIIFGDVPSLLDELKKTFNDPTASTQKVLSRYVNCDLLILDDVGTETLTKQSSWPLTTIYQIVNGRYNDEKPIIVTSNYNLEELQKYYESMTNDKKKAERLTSRLEEMCIEVTLGNRDRRQG